MEKVKRNSPEILGYQCRFVKFPVGRSRKRKGKYYYDDHVDAVFLDDVFIGTIQAICSPIYDLIAVLPDGSCKVYRGASRVKAVSAYILQNLF